MKLSLPSFESLLNNLLQVLKRFPLEILFALGGTWAAIQTTLPEHDWDDKSWLKLIMCCNLGLVFSLSASTYAETARNKPAVLWSLRLVILLLVVFYFFTFPEQLIGKDYYRFFLLAAMGHLLVSVAPFPARGNINSFWHYNKSLFLRFLTAVLYSAVLFAGLSVALLALDELFGVEIKSELYWRLWLVIAGVFNTIMFLAGIPADALSSEQDRGYPRGLKIFTQFVLIPLVSIYVLILLSYELKILVLWDLPRGWVSNLIIAFAVFGVLSLLLVFPIRNTSENKWINWYGKTFYWIMLPLVGLLFLAIGKRILDYGFTEERFIVLITGCWLLFVALYFLFGKNENIKLIPASLILVILITVTLAFPLSVYSQKKRMLDIFARNNMLKEGRVIPAGVQPGRSDRSEITSIVRYLHEMHGSAPFREHFSAIPGGPDKERYGYGFTDSLLRGIQVDPAYRYDTVSGTNQHFRASVETNRAIPTTGYDFYLAGESYRTSSDFRVGGHSIDEDLHMQNLTASLIVDEKDTISFNLKPLVSRLINDCLDRGTGELALAPEEASLEMETGKFKARLYLKELSGSANGQGGIDSASLWLRTSYLIKFKN